MKLIKLKTLNSNSSLSRLFYSIHKNSLCINHKTVTTLDAKTNLPVSKHFFSTLNFNARIRDFIGCTGCIE